MKPQWSGSAPRRRSEFSLLSTPEADWREDRCEYDQELKTKRTLLLLEAMSKHGIRHPEHGHSYIRYTVFRPRVCYSCDGPIWGPFSNACHCLACGLIVHRQCAMKLTRNPCGKESDPHKLQKSFNVQVASDETNGVDSVAKIEEDHGSHEETQTTEGPTDKRDADTSGSSEYTNHAISACQDGSLPISLSEPSSHSRTVSFEAGLALIGALVGGIVEGSSKVSQGGSSSQPGLSRSTLKEAGTLAGAYTGFKRSTGAITAHGDDDSIAAAAGPSPAALAWSHLAQRVRQKIVVLCSLDSEQEGQESGTSLIKTLEYKSFARNLLSNACQNSDNKGNNGGSVSASASAGGPLITEILSSKCTPPGYLWAVCLACFIQRHPQYREYIVMEAEPAVEDGTTGRSVAAEVGEDMIWSTMTMEASCCEDASAIIHEVALVLVEYVPELLSSVDSYEEAGEAVEGVIMRVLYPAVMAECHSQSRVRILCQKLEGWYADNREDRLGENEYPQDGIKDAVQELISMTVQVTPVKKITQILSACIALGQGKLDLTADELLPLLAQTLRLAAIPALPVHLAFIEEMSDTGALLGAEGYALTSLQVVLSLIADRGGEENKREEENS